ncbi:MAG: MBL fold metallo-hydrolase [Marinomonas sp.]
MRKYLITLMLCVLLSPSSYAASTASKPYVMKVTLLGTGNPIPSAQRFGPSTLVEAGGHYLLFDVGRGSIIRLWQLKAPINKITDVFLTHYHSDHINGLSDFWMTGWMPLPPVSPSRTTPLHLYGPTGIKNIANGLTETFKDNTRIHIEDEHLPPEGIKLVVTEFTEGEHLVYQKYGIRVTSFKNDHGKFIHPSVGYKIQYKGKTVVISGDTRKSQTVINEAKGADLLVHEVAAVRDGLLQKHPNLRAIFEHHINPRQAGEVFTEAKPKLAAFTHVALLGTKDFPKLSVDELIAMTRETYKGPLVVGEDLMSFEIGDSVKVMPWKGEMNK